MQRDRLLLAEVIDAAERLVELTAERTPADFDADRDRRDALLWNYRRGGRPAVGGRQGRTSRCGMERPGPPAQIASCTATGRSISRSSWPRLATTCRPSSNESGVRTQNLPTRNDGRRWRHRLRCSRRPGRGRARCCLSNGRNSRAHSAPGDPLWGSIPMMNTTSSSWLSGGVKPRRAVLMRVVASRLFRATPQREPGGRPDR